MKKIAFLDKDLTLVRSKNSDIYVSSPEDQVLYPEVIDRLREMFINGWEFAIVSNQAGIDGGYKTYMKAFREFDYLLSLIAPYKADILFSPLHSGNACCYKFGQSNYYTYYRSSQIDNYPSFRKSIDQDGTGMIKFYISKQEFEDRENAKYVMIGDDECDKVTAEYQDIPFILASDWRRNVWNENEI